jgi:hypothetical protein
MKALRTALFGVAVLFWGMLSVQAQPVVGYVDLRLLGPGALCTLELDEAFACTVKLGQTLQVWARAKGSPAWAPISLIANWLPDNASFESVWRQGEAVQVFTFTPQESHVTKPDESLRVRFIARNDYVSTWRELRIYVRHNRPPVADPGPNQIVRPGQLVLLSAFASADPDGEVLQYRWMQIEGPPVLLFGDETLYAIFLAPAGPAKLVFRLAVSDGAYSVHKDVTVFVTTGLSSGLLGSLSKDRR